MVTGDDVMSGAAIAKQLGIEGEAILGAPCAALDEQERLSRIGRIAVECLGPVTDSYGRD